MDIHLSGYILQDTDEYMYQDKMQFYRKNPNSNRYRCCNDTVLQLADRSVLMQALENQRFEVYLQPKVNFRKELIGGEALIRYHDETGTISGGGTHDPVLGFLCF